MSNSTFGFDKAEDSPGFLLWQVTTCWQREIKKVLEPQGVSHSQFVILAQLLWFTEQKLEVTQATVVSNSNLDKMTVSKSLKKLNGLDLVKRSEYKKDTRFKVLLLTSKGKTLIKSLVPKVEAVDEKFFSELTVVEQQYLIKAFRKLI